MTEAKSGIVTFVLKNDLFGAEMRQVSEIVKIRQIMPVYRADNFLVGITNLRGQIKPVVDLATFMGICQNPEQSCSLACQNEKLKNTLLPAIVLSINQQDIICLVTNVQRIVWVDETEVREVPDMLSSQLRSYLQYVIATPKKPISVVDVAKIFSSPSWNSYRNG